MYLYGGYGAGKSHILWAIKNALQGLALYVDAGDLASKLRSAVGRNEVSDMVDTIAACPVLLLDDFG